MSKKRICTTIFISSLILLLGSLLLFHNTSHAQIFTYTSSRFGPVNPFMNPFIPLGYAGTAGSQVITTPNMISYVDSYNSLMPSGFGTNSIMGTFPSPYSLIGLGGIGFGLNRPGISPWGAAYGAPWFGFGFPGFGPWMY